MKDAIATKVVAEGDDPAIVEVLEHVCNVTHMGFAAVARVTEDRWIACQVLDRIEFGLDPGSEFDIKTTICADIRETGQRIIIDHISEDPEWRTHPLPIIYGFQSYASLPVVLDDGSFYGTLCTMDPARREVSAPETIAVLEHGARRIAEILSARILVNG